MSGVLRVERADAVARVTLARPEVRNAFNAELIGELRAAFEALAAEPPDELRGVVLAGEGAVFCAGADVAWMRAAIGLSLEDNARDATAMQAMFASIDACPVPVVARVTGAALGGGMGLLAVADVVVATADTTFGFTETKLGIVPAVISPFVIAKIGESHSRALFPSGQRFDAVRAQHIGLVHEVADDEVALDARIDEIVAEVLSAGPVAARAAKALVLDRRGRSDEELADETVRRIARIRASPEGQEGLTAFVDRRRPSWGGD
jgi:methylglutaconyl-CoA hydratase